MQDGKCKRKFPKDLAQQTEFNVNGYPLYRRRDQQPLCFTDPEQAAQRNNDSMLIAYFSLNLREDNAHRKGATSFKDIKTVDGITEDTLKNAARAMSLLEDDAEHRQCLRDAVVQHSSSFKLRATLMLSSQDSKKTCQKINVRHV
eukprot:gene16377-biopygen12068